jgi:hypothetical protein
MNQVDGAAPGLPLPAHARARCVASALTRHLLFVVIAMTAGCGDGRPPHVRGPGSALALSVNVPFAELSVPADSRPDGRPPQADVPVLGPWQRVEGSEGDEDLYRAPLPVRPRILFFLRPIGAMQVLDARGREIPHDSETDSPPSWRIEPGHLYLRLGRTTPEPEPGDIRVHYPPAAGREARLNHRFSGIACTASRAAPSRSKSSRPCAWICPTGRAARYASDFA